MRTRKPKSLSFLILSLLLLGRSMPALAEGPDPLITFENHHWTPLTFTVPAGQTLQLKVVNKSPETVEFESFKLNRERVLSPDSTITVALPTLSAGAYDFRDDLHQDVPEGSIVAK